MITSKVFITASAFTLALAGSLLSNSKDNLVTSYNGWDMNTACVLTGPPNEPNCGTAPASVSCTVWCHLGTEDQYLSMAWLSLNASPTCLIVLYRN